MFDVKRQQLQSPNILNSEHNVTSVTVTTFTTQRHVKPSNHRHFNTNDKTIHISVTILAMIQSHHLICIQHVTIYNKMIHKLMNNT